MSNRTLHNIHSEMSRGLPLQRCGCRQTSWVDVWFYKPAQWDWRHLNSKIKRFLGPVVLSIYCISGSWHQIFCWGVIKDQKQECRIKTEWMLDLIIKLSEILCLFLFVCFLFHYLFYVYYIIYSISDFSSVKACSSAKFPLTNRGVRSDSTLFCVKADSISPELDLG